MAPRKTPKHIPFYEFFRQMNRGGRICFVSLLILIAAASGLMVTSASDPTRWTVDVQEVTNAQLNQVKLSEAHVDYRTISVDTGAWLLNGSYVAGPIKPLAWLSILFGCFLCIGIAFFLSGLTKVKSFSAAIGYGLVGLMFLLHGMGQYEKNHLILLFSLLVTGILGILVLLFQREKSGGSVMLRALIFMLVLFASFFLAIQLGGWQAIHSFEVSIFPVCILFVIGWLLLCGRELVNIILLACTNSKKHSRRLPLPVILSLCLMLFGLELLMLQDYYGWKLIKNLAGFPFRPVHLLMLTAVIVPLTIQNLWLKLRDSVTNLAFTLGLMGITLTVVSSLFYFFSQGDYILVQMVERLTLAIFFSTGLFYLFYFIYNFSNSIRERDNFYYLIMMPRRLMYVFVTLFVIFFTLACEGADGMKVLRFFYTSVYNLSGDRELVSGNQEEARLEYQLSTYNLPGDVKGNYNFAWFTFALKQNDFLAKEYYEKATSAFPFHYAAINKGNIETLSGKPWEARMTLETIAERKFNPMVGNNLALAWLADKEPDSAIYWLKKTVDLDPDGSTPSANLGMIYLAYGKPSIAKKFLEASVQGKNPGAVAVTNALFYNLSVADSIPVDTNWLKLPSLFGEEAPKVNLALWLMHKENYSMAKNISDSLLAKGETPSSMLLDGMLKFESGDFELGYSRILYLASYFPEYAALSWHYLGYACFKRHVPEMASYYFHKAAEAGLKSDLFLEAEMEIDMGNQEQALMLLSYARGVDESLMLPVAKEIAMLQASQGFLLEASLEWDMKDISFDERMRIGLYAGRAGNIPIALDNFSQIIQSDPKNVLPYIEMGRIRLQRQDSLAANELNEGLKKAPDNYELQKLMVLALLLNKETTKAEQLLNKIKKGHEKDPEIQLGNAELLLAKKDVAGATKSFKAIVKEHPMYQEGIIHLAKIYRSDSTTFFEGQQLLSDAIRLNSRNSEFQYYLAGFEEGLGRVEEAGLAAQKAMDLRPDDLERNRRISKEFAGPLKLIHHPGEE